MRDMLPDRESVRARLTAQQQETGIAGSMLVLLVPAQAVKTALRLNAATQREDVEMHLRAWAYCVGYAVGYYGWGDSNLYFNPGHDEALIDGYLDGFGDSH